MERRKCSKCGRVLPIDKFYKKNKHSDEPRGQCKECCNSWQLKYYDDNREARVKYQSIYEKNKRGQNKKYELCKEDKEELDLDSKKYIEGKREINIVISRKPIRNKSLAKDYKEYFASKHEGKIYCEICGKWHDIPKVLEVHHLVEISKYEKSEKEYTTFEDVILLCPTCHKIFHLKNNIEKVKEVVKNNS